MTPWDRTETAHNLRRLLIFDSIMSRPIAARIEDGEYHAYVDDCRVQPYGYKTYREALRVAAAARYRTAEHYRPEGWRFRPEVYLDVNLLDLWTPDDATKLLPFDAQMHETGVLSWS